MKTLYKIRPIYLFYFLLFSQLIVSVLDCKAQSVWEIINRQDNVHSFHSVIINSDTSYYVLSGYTGNSLLKYDKYGNKLWSKPAFGCCRNLILGLDNYLYSFGMDSCSINPGNSTNRVFVAKYNLSGDTVWTKKLGPPGSVVNAAMGYFMHDTALLVAVSSEIYSSLQQLTLLKLDTNGNFIWGDKYPPYKFPYDIKEYNGEYKIAAGYGVLTIDKEGNETGDEQTEVEIRSINIDQDGNYIGSNYNEIFKLNNSLDIDWMIDVSDSIDCLQSLLFNSHIYATGQFNDYSDGRKDEVFLGKINSFDGSIEWSRLYGGPRDEKGYYLQHTLDGGTIIAAASESWSNEYNGYLIKTDSMGFTSNCADSLGILPDTITACSGVQTYISNNSIGSYAGYTWYFNSDSIHSGMEPLLFSYDSIGVHNLSLVSCTDTLKTFFIVLPWPEPEISFAIYGDSVQYYNSSDLNAFWKFGDGGWSDEKEPSHTYMENGEYIVSLTLDNLNCWETADTTLTILINIEDELSEDQILVYPNPTSDFLSISYPQNGKQLNLSVAIYNQFGQQLISQHKSANIIDVSSLKPGIYFIDLVSIKGKIVEKFVIR